MNTDIIFRLAWAAAIILIGLAAYKLTNRIVLVRAATQTPLSQPGEPSILYFTTPDCSPCKTVQRPALQRVQQAVGERIKIIEVNAYEQPELARQWGVLSVPTTFVLDSSGKPLHINHGVTQAEKLLKQLQAIL